MGQSLLVAIFEGMQLAGGCHVIACAECSLLPELSIIQHSSTNAQVTESSCDALGSAQGEWPGG